MKLNRIINVSLLSFVVFISACSKDFKEINTSPDQVENPTLDYILPNIQLTLSDNAYYTNLTIIGQLMYQVSNNGTNFTTLTIGTNKEYHFEYQYATAIKNLVDFVDRTKESEELINYNSIGRIMKAYAFHNITDLYGDIPYFNAGKGYIDRNFQPEYDDQKLIYEDMLNELKDAAEKFNPAQKRPGATDIIYKGDISKWKKMAYSLMLRLALRINKADPETSAKWISTAINGGMFESNDDNFTVFYKPNTYYATISNGQPTPFIYYTSWKLAAPFVDFLKNNNDPRIYIYSIVPDQNPADGVIPESDTAAANQFGLPPFTPGGEIPKPLPEYSVSPPTTFGKYDAPFIHISYSEVQYMMAEIAARELVPEASKTEASAYYEKGLRAAMNQLDIYGGSYKLSEASINKYIMDHPLNTASTEAALEQINTQYWLETHYNFYETFSNWRRSGYPKFDETKFVIPRRMPYTVKEANINTANLQKAIERQGPDLITTRVWWDK